MCPINFNGMQMSISKNSLHILHIMFAIVSLIMVVSCEDGLDLLEQEPPIIELLGSDADVIQKNIKDQVPVSLNIRIAASERLGSFIVAKNGELFDSLTFEDEFSFIYDFEYPLEDGLKVGDSVFFDLSVTDKLGETTSRTVTIAILERLFFVSEIEKGGQVLKTIEGTIDTVFTMTSETGWLVIDELRVQPGAVWKIEPGTTIYMETDDDDLGQLSSIMIERGARIEAIGTKDAPIVFTSDKVLSGNPQAGDWGSFNLRGASPVNSTENGESENGTYGGQQPDDDSGIMRYVRIEYTGKVGADAFRLQGVGSGTTLEYIQLYRCNNEGLKISGGTFNMRYFVGTAIYDDNMEWENGFMGKGQFWVLESDTERQSEISFYGKNQNARVPQSDPVFSNVTILGPGENAEFEFNGNLIPFNNRGMRLTNTTHGRMYNFIITQFNDDGVRVEKAFDLGDISGLDGNLVVAHSHSFSNKDNFDLDGKYFIYDPSDPNSDPANAIYNNSQEVIPGIGVGDYVGSLRDGAIDPTILDPWFLPATYIGAIENEANDWTSDGSWCRNLDGTIR